MGYFVVSHAISYYKKPRVTQREKSAQFEQWYDLAAYYRHVLGLEEHYSEDDLNRKYSELIEKYNATNLSSLDDEFRRLAEEKTKTINEAYRYLSLKTR